MQVFNMSVDEHSLLNIAYSSCEGPALALSNLLDFLFVCVSVRRAELLFSSLLLMVDVVVVIRLFHLVFCGSSLMKAVGLVWIGASELAFGLMIDFG